MEIGRSPGLVIRILTKPRMVAEMTVQCTATAEAVTGVLLAGDVLLNLSHQPLNTTADTLFAVDINGKLQIVAVAASLKWRPALAGSLPQLLSSEVQRIVVVADEDCSNVELLVRELATQRIPHLHCTLMNSCDADAFMDEEDTEAVTERLRQLGYI